MKLDWIEGAPAKFEAGMIVQWDDGVCSLCGHFDPALCNEISDDKTVSAALSGIVRWAWIVKPHELEWLEAMAPKVAK